MIVAIELDGVVELVEKIKAVASEEICAANSALLQASTRVERLGEGFGVTADDLALLQLGAGGLGVEAVELVAHL